MLPTLFISHGAPTLPLDDVPARDFLAALSRTLPRPRAVLVVSAHWETDVPALNAVEVNETIHDFFGFPPSLYRISYPAPGAPELAERIADLIGAQGMQARLDHRRGLDHGAWVPLSLLYPGHDIPALQLSVQSALGPGHHLQLGRAIAGLRQEGILVLASGSFTHDLSNFRHGVPEFEPEWVTSFADWFDQALVERRLCDLLAYRSLAPNAVRNHPTDEHLLPLFVALGAAGTDARAERLHTSTTFGVLRMDAYAFN